MPDMVSLKRTPSEEVAVESGEREDFFPHSMFLDEDDVAALGLDGVQLGDERQMVATVRATSISSNENEQSGKRRSVTLVLTEAQMSSGKSQASRMFGENNGYDQQVSDS